MRKKETDRILCRIFAGPIKRSAAFAQELPLRRHFAFLEFGEQMRFVEGDTIIKRMSYVNSAYLIADGKVSIWKEKIQLATLEKKSFLGETFYSVKTIAWLK